jgi:hypothetical protein
MCRSLDDKIIPIIINMAPIKWKVINSSLNINIAIIVLKIGIKCKKIPDLLEPIIEIPLIQKKKEASPGNNTTYPKVNTKGICMFNLWPNIISRR